MVNSIKMVDLHGQYLKVKEEVDQAIQTVINSSSFINGSAVDEFCQQLAEYLGVKKVISCANGTDALQISYQSLGLKPGDEVIMPTFNYVASVEAAALLGLKPVFVDVRKDSFNINENRIEWKPFKLFNKGTQEVYEIEFENGETVICTPDHKWYVSDNGETKVVKASELTSYMHILTT